MLDFGIGAVAAETILYVEYGGRRETGLIVHAGYIRDPGAVVVRESRTDIRGSKKEETARYMK
jgi:hypothetical protein